MGGQQRTDPNTPEETIGGLGPPAEFTAPTFVRGAHLGRYVVLEHVGSGGMGRVARAYDPALQREVALKLVKTPSREARTRILREAQAMARLSHPNVLPVFDVGEHQGEVFIAMEFIDGLTLRTWLEERPQWQDVVDVMVQAGRGLAAAHDAGLIHRDFKPGNVLISKATSGERRVRVADFGLARSVAGPAVPDPVEDGVERMDVVAPDGTLTSAGTTLGTPAYMSPEQHAARPADERSDQYSYCVSLFEGLYGVRPFEQSDVDALREAKRRGPSLPSGPIPRRIAAVVTRGLSPDPEDRYGSMADLLVELERDPARARTRFLSLAASLVVGGGVVAFALIRHETPCTSAREQIEEVWNQDRRDEIAASFAATRLPYAADTWVRASASLDAYAETWIAGHTDACEATRTRGEQSAELMDARMRCLAARRRNLKAYIDELADADTKTVNAALGAIAGLPDVAPCADPAYASASVAPPTDSAIAARVAAIRSDIARSLAAGSAGGRLHDAVDIARVALAAAAKIDYPPLRADAQIRLGTALAAVAEFEDAAAYLETGYFDARRAGMDREAGLAAAHLSWVLARLGDTDAARGWIEHARVDVERFGTERDRATLLDKRGAIAAQEGERQEALQLFSQAVEHKRRAFPPKHFSVAGSLNNRANVLHAMGRLEEARAAYEEALDILETSVGLDHPNLGTVLVNLANVHEKLGHSDAALEFLERALPLREAQVGPNHPDLAVALAVANAVYESHDRREEARAAGERALAILIGAFGEEGSRAVSVATQLARQDRRFGDLERARERFARALSAAQRGEGIVVDFVPELTADLGNVLADLGRTEEAAARWVQAIELVEAAPRPAELEGPALAEARQRLPLAQAAAAAQ